MQKFLYIVEFFVPASFSDGGMLTVIAENDEECFDLIAEWDNEKWTQYYGKLRENILKASRFALLENEESRIVETFTLD
jgi:hypothetical protein